MLLLAPEAVVHPSFQMSFAATLALIAAYERGLPWIEPSADTLARRARRAVGRARDRRRSLLASLVAGLATTPYAAFHFHRLAPYGVLANLLAMPIVSVWVMPAGLLALIAMPFGFDGLLWRLMGEGIDWMIAVALWVASLPGAVGRMRGLRRRPAAARHRRAGRAVPAAERRCAGAAAALIVAGVRLWRSRAPLPDVLVAADGQAVAVRGADGRLAIHAHRQRRLRRCANGSPPTATRALPTDQDAGRRLRAAIAAGCVARLADGRLVSLVLRARRLRGGLRAAPPWSSTDARGAAGLRGAGDRPQASRAAQGAMALRRDGEGLDADGGAAGRPGPAVGARRAPPPASDTGGAARAAAAARRDAAGGGSGGGRLSAAQ